MPDYDDVEVSRYVLGRWPQSWQEVEQSCKKYYGRNLVDRQFASASLTPVTGDACIAKFRLHNILGFPYTEERRLTWSVEEERKRAEADPHTDLATSIAADYLMWVRYSNGGRLPAKMDGIRRNIEFWNTPGTPFSGTRITNVQLDSPLGRARGEAAALVVSFADGASRRIPLDRSLGVP